jgi:hypothetical protein
VNNRQFRDALETALGDYPGCEDALISLADDLAYVKAMVEALGFLDGGFDETIAKLEKAWPEATR